MTRITIFIVICLAIAGLNLNISATQASAQEEPSSRCGLVTLNDKPLTLAGDELRVGEKAPYFTLLDEDSNQVSMDEYRGKTLVISVMPSIDTPT